MRLTNLGARELFSFDALELDDLPRTLVVVGPNGAGKTNLLRLLQIVHVAIDRAATFSQDSYQELVRFAASLRLGAGSAHLSTVRLSITLTEPWEHELLTLFVRAAIASGLLRDTPTNSDASGVFAWVRQHISETELAPLTTGTVVVDLVDAPTGPWAIGYEFEAGGEHFRWVLEGMPTRGALLRVADAQRPNVPSHLTAQKLEVDEQRVPKRPFTLADLLPPQGEGRVLTLDAGPQWAELTREFVALAGLPPEPAQRNSYSIADVLKVVLDRGLVLLGDLRQPPRMVYTLEDASVDPSPTDGRLTPVRLFRLKNGTAASRRQYAGIQDLFHRLTGRSFDVALASTPLRQTDESAQGLQVSVLIQHNDQDLPVEFAGAGIWEALLLSSVLPESAGVVAVLDEPARNLHPTMQRQLLTEVRGAAGQFIMATHSPYLMSLQEDRDLAGIVRLHIERDVTRVCRIATGRPDTARLRKALGESTDARALLFARGVVLVEGGTELGGLPEWFAKSTTARRSGAPDALNLVTFSVDGDQGFKTIVAFLHALGVPWAIVCDGSVYQFGKGKSQIFEQVLSGGIDSPALLEAVDQAARGEGAHFEKLRTVGECNGIFTLAEGMEPAVEGFENYIETVAPGRLAEAEKVVGRSKPRQGRHVAFKTDCPPEVDALYAKLLVRLGVA